MTKEYETTVNTRYERVAWPLERLGLLTQPLSYDHIKVKLNQVDDWMVLTHEQALRLTQELEELR